ncbi:hypothetical protein VNO80_19275 [Phaseolus coccineus]|uniref:Uncharacterized protein n=1 Tax=Phaseolus coccineus TaxID=3886 RepID=A0AAN9R4L0_PHACN
METEGSSSNVRSGCGEGERKEAFSSRSEHNDIEDEGRHGASRENKRGNLMKGKKRLLSILDVYGEEDLNVRVSHVCLEEAEGTKLPKHRYTERRSSEKVLGSPLNFSKDGNEKRMWSRVREATPLRCTGATISEEKEDDRTSFLEKSV